MSQNGVMGFPPESVSLHPLHPIFGPRNYRPSYSVDCKVVNIGESWPFRLGVRDRPLILRDTFSTWVRSIRLLVLTIHASRFSTTAEE